MRISSMRFMFISGGSARCPQNTHAHEKGEVSCHGGIDQDLKAEITF